MSQTDVGTRGAVGAVTADAPPRVGGAWRRVATSSLVVKVAAGLLLLALWQVSVELFAPDFVARPTRVVAVLPSVVAAGELPAAAWSTLLSVVEGLLIALAVGVPLGLTMGRVRAVDWLLRFYVNGLYAMPMIALAPLVIVWFGHGDLTRLVLVAFAAFFPVALNAADGARLVPEEHLEVARSFRAGPLHVLFGVALPASLPYLIAGYRLAAGRALVAAVVAEFLAAIDGSLGFWILLNARSFRLDEAMVGVAVLVLFGVAMTHLVEVLTRRLMPWYRRA